MKTSKIIILAVVVIALAAVVAGVFYYLNLPKQELTTPEPQPQQGPETSQENATPQGQQHAVLIENFAYSQKELTISVGDTVTWTNKDQVKHNVASDDGNELAGPLLAQGESYSHTFNAPGTYAYHCTPHPFMQAKIIVQ